MGEDHMMIMGERFSDGCGGSPFMMSPLAETQRGRPYSLSEPASLHQSPSSSDDYSSSFVRTAGGKRDSVLGRMNKFRRQTHCFAYRVREHVRLGAKLSETVKGKVSLGARIIQEGGREKIFKQIFGVKEGEELLKASQCYLYTTAGPIAGLLFISTQNIAFCSERSVSSTSPSGDVIRSLYKVLIPVKKIKRAMQSENVNKPAQKYIEIVTEDDFEFWFLGFLRYEKAFKNLQKVISNHN